MRIPAGLVLSLAVASLVACERAPVRWMGPPEQLEGANSTALGQRWELAVDSLHRLRFRVRYRPRVAEADSACPGSLMGAVPMRRETYAGWFLSRPDSSVVLMVARSEDYGRTWSKGVVADGRDRGRRGCDRPPPTVAVDTANGYAHLAYFLEPAEGAGVWLVHSMEHGKMWHSPIAVAFGADPAYADITADQDTVVVAYESPNANEGWIGLALSSTDGHLIDWRIPEISGRSVPVESPRVLVRGRGVIVAWVTQRGGLVMNRRGILE